MGGKVLEVFKGFAVEVHDTINRLRANANTHSLAWNICGKCLARTSLTTVTCDSCNRPLFPKTCTPAFRETELAKRLTSVQCYPRVKVYIHMSLRQFESKLNSINAESVCILGPVCSLSRELTAIKDYVKTALTTLDWSSLRVRGVVAPELLSGSRATFVLHVP